MILWNDGATLASERLPYQLQLSPIQEFVVNDLDADGDMDVVSAGNWFVSEIETPRADAGVGAVLINDGSRQFSVLPSAESGFFANGDVRGLAGLRDDKGTLNLIVANNNAKTQVFTLR